MTILKRLLNLIIKIPRALFYFSYTRYLKFILEMKVREALRRSKLENRKYIVTMMWGRPRCYSKQMLKENLKRRKFRKGVTIEQIEREAYFVTN